MLELVERARRVRLDERLDTLHADGVEPELEHAQTGGSSRVGGGGEPPRERRRARVANPECARWNRRSVPDAPRHRAAERRAPVHTHGVIAQVEPRDWNVRAEGVADRDGAAIADHVGAEIEPTEPAERFPMFGNRRARASRWPSSPFARTRAASATAASCFATASAARKMHPARAMGVVHVRLSHGQSPQGERPDRAVPSRRRRPPPRRPRASNPTTRPETAHDRPRRRWRRRRPSRRRTPRPPREFAATRRTRVCGFAKSSATSRSAVPRTYSPSTFTFAALTPTSHSNVSREGHAARRFAIARGEFAGIAQGRGSKGSELRGFARELQNLTPAQAAGSGDVEAADGAARHRAEGGEGGGGGGAAEVDLAPGSVGEVAGGVVVEGADAERADRAAVGAAAGLLDRRARAARKPRPAGLALNGEPTGVVVFELRGVVCAEPGDARAARSERRQAATRARSTGERCESTWMAADASRSPRNTPDPSASPSSAATAPWNRICASRALASRRLRLARETCAHGRPDPCAALGGAPFPCRSASRSSASDQSDSDSVVAGSSTGAESLSATP